MTADHTQVDADELDAFAKGASGRSDDTRDVADAVANIDIRTDMLGMMFFDFALKSAAEKGELATKLHAMVDVLKQDGEGARANASAARQLEARQADDFKQIEGS